MKQSYRAGIYGKGIAVIGAIGLSTGGCPINEVAELGLKSDADGGQMKLYSQFVQEKNDAIAAENAVFAAAIEGGNATLAVNEVEMSVRKGGTAMVVLQNATANPANARFQLVNFPQVGRWSKLESVGANAAQFSYTPPFDFEGVAEFQYMIQTQSEYSDIASIKIIVQPEVQFAVLDDASGDQGVIRVMAATVGGAELPDATYVWNVDGVEHAMAMETGAIAELPTEEAGEHVVGLSIQYPGAANAVMALTPTGNELSPAVTHPRISGVVRDDNGAPFAGLELEVSGEQSVFATSDENGQFVMTIKPGSSGLVAPVGNANVARVAPTSRSFSNVDDNQRGFDFVVDRVANSDPSPEAPDVNPDDPQDDDNGDDTPAPSVDAPDRNFSTYEDVVGVFQMIEATNASLNDVHIVIVSLPEHGVLRNTNSQSAIVSQQLPFDLGADADAVEYVPAPNFSGSDSFEYRYELNGNPGASGNATVSVAAVNDTPTIQQGVSALLVTSLDQPGSVSFVAVDVDAAANELAWDILTAPQNGTIAFDNSVSSSGDSVQITFTPANGFVGSDSFEVRCSDADDASDTIQVNVTVSADVVVANAGADRNAFGFQEIELSAAASLAPENATISWEQVSGPSVALIDAQTERTSFRVPAVLEATALEFELTVDANGVVSTDRVVVSAEFSRQALIYAADAALQRIWDARVDFDVDGETMSGFASFAAIDGGAGFWGNESGSVSDAPLWDFQGRDGIAGMLVVYTRAYDITGNKSYLRKAQKLGDSLLAVQDALGGGWFQDSSFIDGAWKNVSVWGNWGARLHAVDEIQDLFTFDDSTSQSCAMALLRLHEVGGGAQYLAGAKRLGDELVGLKDIQYIGLKPYENGGFPQVLPFTRALTAGYNQNLDPRNPDGPYMPHKTLNDNTTSDSLVFLMELYRVTGEQQYLDAVRLNVDYLLERHAAYGSRGWGQQYHFLDDHIAWGRKKEPPAFVTCENRIVDALLLWRERETDATRVAAIESALLAYAEWLRDDVAAPTGHPDQIWRYYNHDPLAGPDNDVVFASEYVLYFGEENEGNAGSGQPYRNRWDSVWVDRFNVREDSANLDFGGAANYVAKAPENPVGIIANNWQIAYTSQNLAGAWPQSYTVEGDDRVGIATSASTGYCWGLVRRISQLSDPLVDSDADGFNDDVEIANNTDPFDSDSFPQ